MNFQICIADRIVDITCRGEALREMCAPYLVSGRRAPDLTVRVTEADLAREAEITRREAARGLRGICTDCDPGQLESVAAYRQIATGMVDFDTFVMHGSVIATAGAGCLIAAPSGVGKTTRTRLWLDTIPDSIVVNGDKPLLRVSSTGAVAYGTPWSGKEGWNTNTAVPLRAILLLERSGPGEEDSVTGLSYGEAFPRLLRQTFMPASAGGRRRTLALLQAMAGPVRVYRFRSGPTAKAVALAWRTVSANLS